MKKTLITLCALATILNANAQEAFKHLSIGLEVGTTGGGVELALPIVTDHLVLTAGYNFPNIAVNSNFSFSTQAVKDVIANANNKLQQAGISDRITDTFSHDTRLDAKANLNFGAIKAMLEYYPWKKSSFHIVAGAYFGMGDFISVNGMTEKNFWTSIKTTQTEIDAIYDKHKSNPQISGMDHDVMGKLKANVDGKTFMLTEKDGCGHFDAQLAIAKIRPYVGIGIGRSIPETHFSVQGDLGVWFHGTPSLQNSSSIAYDPTARNIDLGSALTTVKKISVWPQLSFRLIYKIF